MAPDAPTPPARKKSRKTLVLTIGAVVVLGGAAAAYWTFRAQAASAVEAAPVEVVPAIVHFDPFVVNLADPGGRRFLRVSVELVVGGEEEANAFSENAVMRARVRSSILEMLAQQTADRLTTVEGKAALKTAIVERASAGAERLKISDVLFSEFIVQ